MKLPVQPPPATATFPYEYTDCQVPVSIQGACIEGACTFVVPARTDWCAACEGDVPTGAQRLHLVVLTWQPVTSFAQPHTAVWVGCLTILDKFHRTAFRAVRVALARVAVCCPGYSAAFAQLYNAAEPDEDPLPDVPDGPAFLAQHLGTAAAAQPGQMAARISASLPPGQQQQLQALLQAKRVTLA